MSKIIQIFRQDARFAWISAGLLFLLLRIVFAYSPAACEFLYARGIFLAIRAIMDNTLGLLPFASLYLLVILLMWWAFSSLRKALKAWKSLSPFQRIKEFLLSTAAFLGFVLVTFLGLWGFNYARQPFEAQSGINAQPLSLEALKTEANWAISNLIAARASIPNIDTNALSPEKLAADYEHEMSRQLETVLAKMNFPTTGKVRGREIYPQGLLMRLGATGVYLPWVSEGHIDAALPASQKPFTMAHELGHGYGFGDEAVCNFLGFAACMGSKNPLIQYSGYLSYYRYLANEIHTLDKPAFDSLRAQIPTGARNDLNQLYAVYERYPCFYPNFQNVAYNAFLQTQGVKEGVLSYNRMILLVAAWRKTM